MKINRIISWKRLLATGYAASSLVSAEITERDLGAFQRPSDEPDESIAAESAEGALVEIAKTAAFKSWKTFEDDRVKFIYPDHEQITIEVKVNEPVRVGRDRVSDVDSGIL